jgi:hypothetical protein
LKGNNSMSGHCLRDAGGMNPLAMGEPILGAFLAECRASDARRKSQDAKAARASRVVEMKSAPAPWLSLVGWLSKRAAL